MAPEGSKNTFTDLTGTTLKSYHVLQLLGVGGFGAVYHARQAIIERDVAIKVILPQYANRPDFIRSFEAEAQTIASLEHPHIVPLYDYWREPDSAYLVMRLVRGGNMRKIQQGVPLDLPAATELFTQIASALSYSHQHGVIHRDVKTDNILSDREGNYYLSDFGIAINTHHPIADDTMRVYGTPSYLSPEQIRGEPVVPQSDIYSLGIVLYELLTGVQPFFEFTPAAILHKQLNERMPPLADLRPDLPVELNAVLQKATAKRIAQRYDTAIAFVHEWRQVVHSQPIQVMEVTTTHHITVPAPTLPIVIVNPFKGLRAFERADAGHFHGRQRLIARLIERFSNDTAFLAIIGASGSGKSSLVKAGLLPAIARGALKTTDLCYITEMVPGNHPFEQLATAILAIASRQIAGLQEELQRRALSLIDVVERMLPVSNARVILFIDQFEELFTLVTDEAERARFIELLVTTLNTPGSRIKVIITLRADFYDRPFNYGAFGLLVSQHTEVVLPMSADELQEVIVEPLKPMGMTVELPLIGTIIADVQRQPGALPLLQYTLTQLFEQHDDYTLRLDSYRVLGGLTGALSQRADEIYNSLDAEHQRVAEQMFLRLVAVDGTVGSVRRRVLETDLLSLTPHPQWMRDVLQRYGEARLITFDRDPVQRLATVEVAHEALLTMNKRLQDWLSTNAANLRLQASLAAECTAWEHADRDASFLARGTRLQQFEELAADARMRLTPREITYIMSSVFAREELQRLEAERVQEKQRLQARQRASLRLIAVVMTILGAFGVSAALVASVLAQQARGETRRAEAFAAAAEDNLLQNNALLLSANSRTVLNGHNAPLALALALAADDAYTPAPTEVLRTLSNAAYAPGIRWRSAVFALPISDVRLSADGTQTAVAIRDGSLVVVDNTTGAFVAQISVIGTTPTQVAWLNPETLIAGFTDGTLRTYDLLTRHETAQVMAHGGAVVTLVVSPNGKLIASSGMDVNVRLWQVGADSPAYSWNTRGIALALAFSQDSTQLASGTGDATLQDIRTDITDRTVRVWNTQTGALLQTIRPRSGEINTLAFYNRDRAVTVGVWDQQNEGTVRVYRLEDAVEQQRIFISSAQVVYLDYNHDQTTLLVSTQDGTLQQLDAERFTLLQTFSGFEMPLRAIAATEEYIVFGQNADPRQFKPRNNSDNTYAIERFDLVASDSAVRFEGHTEPVHAGAISPDGSLAATGGGPSFQPDDTVIDTTIQLWEIATGTVRGYLLGHDDTVTKVAFVTQDILLSTSWDGSVAWWILPTRQQFRRIYADCGRIEALALDSTREHFAIGCADGTVHIGDTNTGSWLGAFTASDQPVVTLAFRPDTLEVVVPQANGTLRLYSSAGDVLATSTQTPGGTINALVVDAEGTVYTGSNDGAIRQWHLPDLTQIDAFPADTVPVTSLALNADGTQMLEGRADAQIVLWNTVSMEYLYRYEGHTDQIYTLAFTPSGNAALSTAADHNAIIWHVNAGSDQLRAFIPTVRVPDDLTCSERLQYNVPPLCEG